MKNVNDADSSIGCAFVYDFSYAVSEKFTVL